MTNKLHPVPQRLVAVISDSRGFTLIELMIVLAIIAVLLALAIPVYSNYVIRTKIAEGLSVTNAAKTAIASTCVENRNLTNLTNLSAGYYFQESTDPNSYVADIQASGPCTAPVITIMTKNTGQSPNPVLTLTGQLDSESGHIGWLCRTTNTPNNLVPATCRS